MGEDLERALRTEKATLPLSQYICMYVLHMKERKSEKVRERGKVVGKLSQIK